MPTRSRHKRLEKLSQPQYALLRDLTDEAAVDAATLEALVNQLVADRLALSDSLRQAAEILLTSANPVVRRSGISRAYYAAYHAARAMVFLVHHRDEDRHEALPAEIDKLLGEGNGETLKELKRLRNEFDYSPYPGPNTEARYDEAEIDAVINAALGQAMAFIQQLAAFRAARG
jgi:uncharacterized protein (UPF0332 family)